MKIQIKSFSTHQTAKVFAVLMFLMSLVIFVPMLLVMSAVGPGVDAHGHPMEPPYVFMAAMPFFYLVFGYLMTAAWCWTYNKITKYIGGIEFESAE
ncbi:MAG: hypothetical protein PSX71_14830 [bacterium]|nr:hypothetical protein [bacterium]